MKDRIKKIICPWCEKKLNVEKIEMEAPSIGSLAQSPEEILDYGSYWFGVCYKCNKKLLISYVMEPVITGADFMDDDEDIFDDPEDDSWYSKGAFPDIDDNDNDVE